MHYDHMSVPLCSSISIPPLSWVSIHGRDLELLFVHTQSERSVPFTAIAIYCRLFWIIILGLLCQGYTPVFHPQIRLADEEIPLKVNHLLRNPDLKLKYDLLLLERNIKRLLLHYENYKPFKVRDISISLWTSTRIVLRQISKSFINYK